MRPEDLNEHIVKEVLGHYQHDGNVTEAIASFEAETKGKLKLDEKTFAELIAIGGAWHSLYQNGLNESADIETSRATSSDQLIGLNEKLIDTISSDLRDPSKIGKMSIKDKISAAKELAQVMEKQAMFKQAIQDQETSTETLARLIYAMPIYAYEILSKILPDKTKSLADMTQTVTIEYGYKEPEEYRLGLELINSIKGEEELSEEADPDLPNS